MTAITIDYEKLKGEIVEYLRNSNIYSTSVRGVTTQTDTGNFAGNTTTFDIARANVKNIRSVKTNSVTLTPYIDYTYDTDYSGACRITFTTTQTAGWAYEFVYDYGTDKIFADLPRNDLTVSSFPRIAVDIIGDNSEDMGLGATSKMTTLSFSIYVYDFKTKDIDSTLTTIKQKMLEHQKSFYYQRYVTRIRTGPVMIFQTTGNAKIMFKSIDYMSKFNFEFT